MVSNATELGRMVSKLVAEGRMVSKLADDGRIVSKLEVAAIAGAAAANMAARTKIPNVVRINISTDSREGAVDSQKYPTR